MTRRKFKGIVMAALCVLAALTLFRVLTEGGSDLHSDLGDWITLAASLGAAAVAIAFEERARFIEARNLLQEALLGALRALERAYEDSSGTLETYDRADIDSASVHLDAAITRMRVLQGAPPLPPGFHPWQDGTVRPPLHAAHCLREAMAFTQAWDAADRSAELFHIADGITACLDWIEKS